MFDGLKTMFSWNGRIGRLQFLVVFIAVFLVTSILGTVTGQVKLIGFLGQLLLLPSAIKRIHDIGWSAWWLLLSLIPGLGLIVEIVLLLVKGKK